MFFLLRVRDVSQLIEYMPWQVQGSGPDPWHHICIPSPVLPGVDLVVSVHNWVCSPQFFNFDIQVERNMKSLLLKEYHYINLE